jgi:hypothetical protein
MSFSTYNYIALFLVAMNTTTIILCAIPTVMLMGLVLHKLVWPILSRLICPLSRHNISNRKVLVSVGSLCLAFALNLEHTGGERTPETVVVTIARSVCHLLLW